MQRTYRQRKYYCGEYLEVEIFPVYTKAKDDQLQQLIVVAIAIASVGVAGCLALTVFIVVDKRKKAA